MSNNEVEKKECQKCLHYEMCLDNFLKAKEEGLWELTDEKEYFAHADECDFCAVGYCKQVEGEWVTKDLNNPLYESKKAPHCSNCEYMSFIRYDYCPNCGAKMKGGAG
jgi:hypothetical protein